MHRLMNPRKTQTILHTVSTKATLGDRRACPGHSRATSAEATPPGVSLAVSKGRLAGVTARVFLLCPSAAFLAGPPGPAIRFDGGSTLSSRRLTTRKTCVTHATVGCCARGRLRSRESEITDFYSPLFFGVSFCLHRQSAHWTVHRVPYYSGSGPRSCQLVGYVLRLRITGARNYGMTVY